MFAFVSLCPFAVIVITAECRVWVYDLWLLWGVAAVQLNEGVA